MEKYSAYRDPGTGIHPFLVPVPPQESSWLDTAVRPAAYILGVIRTILVLVLALIYVTLVQGLCKLFSPVPPLRRVISLTVTSIICRLALLIVGVYWIPVVCRKRSRLAKNESWSPKAGDVIVSNWISWLEIAWLSFRFNPIYVLPVADPFEKPVSPSRITPGRRTGTGSAAISLPTSNRPQVKRASVRGFMEVSLPRMITICGRVPPYGLGEPSKLLSIDEVRQLGKKAGRPVALFPESTTSNGRGLLKFSNLFKNVSVPASDFNVFIMCVRIDPPTTLVPTLSLSIPSSIPVVNPVPHIFSISSSILPHWFSIWLLAPGEAPSSSTFATTTLGSNKGDDALAQACSTLISEIGKLKRTGLGWEEKSMFLDFYKGKSGR